MTLQGLVDQLGRWLAAIGALTPTIRTFFQRHGPGTAAGEPLTSPSQTKGPPVSLLSKDVFDPIKAFFSSNSSDPAVQDAVDKLSAAGAAAETAMPVLAADAANLVLAKVPGGSLFQGVIDLFIEGVIGNLLAKHSNPAAALTTVAALPNPATT